MSTVTGEAADPYVLSPEEEDDLLQGAPWRRFAVLGDKRGPDEPLATALAQTIAKWPEIVKKTKVFLDTACKKAKVKVSAEDFAVLSIVFLSTPNHFALDLECEVDETTIWKIDFENGEPVNLSRDD